MVGAPGTVDTHTHTSLSVDCQASKMCAFFPLPHLRAEANAYTFFLSPSLSFTDTQLCGGSIPANAFPSPAFKHT